jgi:hypothetical protein
MKAAIIAGCAALFLATGAAYAMVIDAEHGRCYLSDHGRVPCNTLYGKNWRKIFRDWVKKGQPGRPPFPEEGKPIYEDTSQWKCQHDKRHNEKATPSRYRCDVPGNGDGACG